MTALSGEKTLAELSAEFGVHPTRISLGMRRVEGGSVDPARCRISLRLLAYFERRRLVSFDKIARNRLITALTSRGECCESGRKMMA
jgi:hypothetical protein